MYGNSGIFRIFSSTSFYFSFSIGSFKLMSMFFLLRKTKSIVLSKCLLPAFNNYVLLVRLCCFDRFPLKTCVLLASSTSSSIMLLSLSVVIRAYCNFSLTSLSFYFSLFRLGVVLPLFILIRPLKYSIPGQLNLPIY